MVETSRLCQICGSFEVAYDRHPALRATDLSITGRVIGVVGHNGAGKSTFIKAILNLLPIRGSLSVVDWLKPGERLLPENDMAFCPESGSIFSDISVKSYVEFWCRVRHGDPNYYKKDGAIWIERLELSPLLERFGRELSKGQRRRVQTAIGFISNPKLFLLDEPFDGLDTARTQELEELIFSERDKRYFIVSSHRLETLRRIADTVVVLRNGEFQDYGPKDELLHHLG